MRPGEPVNTTATEGLLWNTRRHESRHKKKIGGWRRLSYAYFREVTWSRPSGWGVRQLGGITSINHSTCKVGVYRWEPAHSPVNWRDWPGINPDHNVTTVYARALSNDELTCRLAMEKTVRNIDSNPGTPDYTSHWEARRYWPSRVVSKYCRISRRWRPGGCYLLVCWTVEFQTSLPPPSDTSFILLADLGQLVIRRL